MQRSDAMNYSAKEVKLTSGDDYIGLIGRGRFEVYKCLIDGKVKALKFLEHRGSKEDIEAVKTSLRNEVVGLIKAKQSPFVVNLVGVVEYQYCSGIIMDYMPRGNLSGFLKAYKPSFNMRIKVLHDIASGIKYLHHCISECEAVSHNDLKPLNIVLDADFTAKICDFDGSDVIARTSGVAHRKFLRAISCYTENYASPELLNIIYNDGKMVVRTRAMDVYSFSMIVYFMLTGQHPFGCDESDLVITKYRRGERPRIVEYDFNHSGSIPGMLQFVTNLMQKCWNQNPKERPKIQSVASDLENYIGLIGDKQLCDEITTLNRNNPITPEGDHAQYCRTFEEFCERRSGRTFQDDRAEVMETEQPAFSCKATTSDPVNYIEVNNLTDPKRGGSIIIKSPTKIIKCQIVSVDNLTPGN